MRLALFQPDIPQNLGAAIRLGACLGVPLDVIEPCGFPLNDAAIRRAAMDYAAMDARMAKGMATGLDTFVKGNATKGVGNQKLTPTVEPDGTKVFRLTSEIIDWEVAPGKTVKAWAYNGMVPGP